MLTFICPVCGHSQFLDDGLEDVEPICPKCKTTMVPVRTRGGCRIAEEKMAKKKFHYFTVVRIWSDYPKDPFAQETGYELKFHGFIKSPEKRFRAICYSQNFEIIYTKTSVN